MSAFQPIPILLLGSHGQVGWELQRSLQPLGPVVSLARRAPMQESLCADLAEIDGLRATVRQLKPQVIVNAAAYTAVDKAESEENIARTVNALAPGVLAEAAQEIGAWMVHFSTDYVFDGSGDAPRSEDALPGPLSVYGQSKLEGEERVRAACPRHLIFRSSWVYGARGQNFAKTMLRLAQERDRLTVIDDQIGAPTGADLMADVTAHAIRQALHDPGRAGTYHLAAAGETSWHGYARFVLDTALELDPDLVFKAREVSPIPTSAYPTAARRPLNSRLDTRRLRERFGLHLPPWQNGVRRMLAEILGTKGHA